MKRYDLTGRRFGALTALRSYKFLRDPHSKCRVWLCKCDCGNLTSVITQNLTSGNTTTCGCGARCGPRDHWYEDIRTGKHIVIDGREDQYE